MKKQSKPKALKEPKELSEIKEEIALLDSVAQIYNRQIHDPNRDMSLMSLMRLERSVKKEIHSLTIKLHTMENRLIDLGRGPIYGIHRVPQLKTNQYSS